MKEGEGIEEGEEVEEVEEGGGFLREFRSGLLYGQSPYGVRMQVPRNSADAASKHTLFYLGEIHSRYSLLLLDLVIWVTVQY